MRPVRGLCCGATSTVANPIQEARTGPVAARCGAAVGAGVGTTGAEGRYNQYGWVQTLIVVASTNIAGVRQFVAPTKLLPKHLMNALRHPDSVCTFGATAITPLVRTP